MKISNSIGISKNITFTSGYDNELRSLFGEAKDLLSDDKHVNGDVLIMNDGKEKWLIKQMDEKKICLSQSCSGGVMLQVADSSKEVVDVLYHNPQDDFCGKYYKYKDKKIFPWFTGDDIKIYSRRIKNMNNIEVELLKNILKKYISEFIAKAK